MTQKSEKFVKSIPFDAIQVGGFRFDVEYPWKEPDSRLKAEVHHRMQQVSVDEGTHDNIRESVIHEICHIIEDQYGIVLKDDNDTRRWAHGWYAFVKQNPEVIRWLLEDRCNVTVPS